MASRGNWRVFMPTKYLAHPSIGGVQKVAQSGGGLRRNALYQSLQAALRCDGFSADAWEA